MEIHQFDFDDAKINKVIDSIISNINQIRNYSSSLVNQLKNNYLAFQEEQRETTFHSDGEFFRSLAYDALVFAALRDGNLESIQDDNLFLLSFNYILKSFPEFFQDKQVKENAIALLDKVDKKTWFFSPKKRRVEKALENYKMIVKRKE